MKIRTRLVVLQKFQTWFFLNFIFYTLVSLSCVAVGAFCWVKIVAVEIFKLAGLISEPTISLLKLNANMGIIILAVLSLSLFALSFLQAFYFSRKIAGPLFAFTRHFEKCERNGRFEKFHLRKGDLFVDMVTTFNRTVDKLNSESSEWPAIQTGRKKVAGLRRFG
ncbi:MAG: hypothetical protein JWQ35_1241 [Bacteriovoracaceae bacterium]|nr:hypothetical protein [Bacteriovoracaceae bacterium]